MTKASRQIWAMLGALLLCTVWFEITPTDLWVQEIFFSKNTQQWLLDRSEPVSRLLLYDGIKWLLIAAATGLAASLLFVRHSQTVRHYRHGIRIIIFSLILIPALVNGLKATTNVACPRDLSRYGGDLPYIGVMENYPDSMPPTKQQRCFPAGHASGGFALLALAFLFESARNQKRAVAIALLTGWMMGLYKMAIGDHFLSHTITTMLLAWLIINIIVLVEYRLFTGLSHRTDTGHMPGYPVGSAMASRQ